MQKHLPFWGLLLSLFTLLCGINYVRYGMFTDGILYAAIAKNMAVGQGNFWFPVFSETSGTFIGHPPLHFYLESLFFRIFGESYLTERLYCLTTVLLVAFLMQQIWRRYLPKYKALSFLPLIFFVLIEDVFLTFTYNLIECTLTVFTTATLLWAIPILQGKKSNKLLLLLGFSATLFAAFLTKGPVGLFPLVIFGVSWLILRKPTLNHAIYWTISTIAILGIGLFVLLQFEAPHQALNAYFNEQVLGSALSDSGVVGQGNIRGNRFHILKRCFDKMLPVLISVILITGIAWRKKVNLFRSATVRRSMFLLSIGLAGTLPYLLILKQASYYLVPAYVFFALGFGGFIAPEVNSLIEKIKVQSLGFRIFRAIIALVVCGVLGYLVTQIGKTDKRDAVLLADVQKISTVVPKNAVIKVQTEKPQFSLIHFLERYHDISVDESNTHRNYLLTDKNANNDRHKNCEKIILDLELFEVYQCK